jgi:hypothetical protein
VVDFDFKKVQPLLFHIPVSIWKQANNNIGKY